MTRRRKPEGSELEARLRHRFGNPDLLAEALTHVSAAGPGSNSYQRLEFLGDRVLGLCAAAMLMHAHPIATEGELSQRLSRLVRRESCAAMAALWDIGPHLRLGPGEMRAGGRRNPAILADVAEAVIGAVYLDGGLDAARALVEHSLGATLGVDAEPPRDAKTVLQEWAQGGGRPLPTYRLLVRSGPDHAPLFEVAAEIDGFAGASGTGASKRAAEQQAAEAFLRREGVWTAEAAPTGMVEPDAVTEAAEAEHV